MCYVIYVALTGLLLIYSDMLLEQYALVTYGADGEWMVVAVGWEMMSIIWPLLVMAMVVASGATLAVTRRLRRKAAG